MQKIKPEGAQVQRIETLPALIPEISPVLAKYIEPEPETEQKFSPHLVVQTPKSKPPGNWEFIVRFGEESLKLEKGWAFGIWAMRPEIYKTWNQAEEKYTKRA